MLPRAVRAPPCIVPSVERVSISSGSSSPAHKSLSAMSAWNSAWSSFGRAAAHFTCALRTNIANSRPMTFVLRKQPACLPTKPCLRWAGHGFALRKSPKRRTGQQVGQSKASRQHGQGKASRPSRRGKANRQRRRSKTSQQRSQLNGTRRKSSSPWETWHLPRKINPIPKVNLIDESSCSDPRNDTGLAPARHRYAEQECDKQACERRFPGNGADGGERLSRLARGCDRLA
jgi:hypothetical protein